MLERMYREWWIKRSVLKITKAVVLPGDVTEINVTKPSSTWSYRPGQYVFLQV